VNDIRTPDWVKDAVFYQIFPDRFAKSTKVPKSSNLEDWDSLPTPHGYKGGDLYGVIEHLDHLEKLGVTAIYFCPVFQSGSNHRYHTHDYFNVDPMLGGNKALEDLIEAAHKKGMKVVLDGVFNHASRGFFQFHDILENGAQSAYLDWFNVKGFPLNAYDTKEPPNYEAWWGYPALPEFNTDTPAVREFLWGVAEYWIQKGIDGWRLDVPNEIDDDAFWQEFRKRVKTINPEAYIVGEIWGDASRWLQGDQFDAVMNYVFTTISYEFLAAESILPEMIAETGLKHFQTLDAPNFAVKLEELLTLHPEEITMTQLNLLGSHDTPRVMSVTGGDISSIKLMTVLQMTLPGAPCVYYGDEIGLYGERDPDCRRGMPWDQSLWNLELLDFTIKAIAVRNQVPALRQGSFKTLYAKDSIMVFARELEESYAIVVFNAGEQPAQIGFTEIKIGTYLEQFSNQKHEVQSGDLFLEIPARTGLVYVLSENA
jgi:cyclomaltodextrinase / maltogenic alpha-amylase / neopullulanase